MSTELSIREERGIDETVWSALSSSIFPGAEDQSIALAWDYCKARGLDVMKKPCHIVPMNVKDAKTGKYSWRDVIMPGIAEARITAFRTGEFAGLSEPEFGPMVDVKFGSRNHSVPEWCQITAYRFLNGEKAGFPNREYFEEAAGTTKDGSLNSMWATRKRGQLSKCAEAGALRKAFPEELGGLSTVEETQVEMRNVTQPTKAKSAVSALPDFKAPEPEQKPVETPEAAETIPPKGKQKKERHVQEVELLDVSDPKTSGGKTWWTAQVKTTKGATVEMNTFSSTLFDQLAGRIGEQIKVTFTQTPKGGFALESFEEVNGEEVA